MIGGALLISAKMMATPEGDPSKVEDFGHSSPHKSPAKAIIISYDNLMQMVYVTFNKSYSNVEMMLVKDGMIVGNSVIGDAEAGMTEVLSLSGYGAGCYEVYIAVDGVVSATAQITVK